MKDTNAQISAYTDQIIHYLNRLMEFVEPEQYDYNLKLVEEAILEIDERLQILKNKVVIEHGGILLTKTEEKHEFSEPRPVLCVETGEVYDSMSAASKETGINSGNISLAARGINKTAGGFHWVPWIPDPEEPLPTTKRRPRKIPVLCVETGKIYESAAAAEADTGVRRSAISQVINGKQASAGGFTWRKYTILTDPVKKLIGSARYSGSDEEQWIKSLQKVFNGDKFLLTSEQLNVLLTCDELSEQQKELLKAAAKPGTEVNQRVADMSKKKKRKMEDSDIKSVYKKTSDMIDDLYDSWISQKIVKKSDV